MKALLMTTDSHFLIVSSLGGRSEGGSDEGSLDDY